MPNTCHLCYRPQDVDRPSKQVEAKAAADVVVEATGPTTVAFAPGETTAAGASGQRSGALTAAGAYLLHVRLGGAPVAGWPRVLHVLPAPADPARCVPWTFA